MAIKNNRIFGIAVPLSLADIPDRKIALENLDINIDDLEIIRGITTSSGDNQENINEGSVFDTNDLQTISNLSAPVWRSFDRYINDVSTYQTSLSDSGGADFQLRGNLEVAGSINSTAFRYTLLDTTDGTPKLKWGDISTSRVSSWSSIGDTIIYGADVEIGGTLKAGKIKTRTAATRKTFDSEVPTHRIKIELNGQTKYIYAMKGIPLKFKGYFRNFDGLVDYNQVLGKKVSWRVYRTDNVGGNEDFVNLGTNTRSTLNYRSPFSAERYIELYYSPDALTRLELTDINVQQIPRVRLNALKRLDFFNNGVTDFPDINFFAPNLEYLNINNNPFYNTSIRNERKVTQLIADKLPATLKTLFLQGCFYGGIEQDIFSKFQNLDYLNLNKSRDPYFYPDSTNPNGELPNFYGTSDGATHKLKTFSAANNDFRNIGASSSTTKNISELESLESLDLYNNYNLVNTNFSLVSQSLRYLRINSTGLSGPTLANITTFETLDAAYTRNFGSFYTGWDGVIGSANTPTNDANYKYAGCTGLTSLSLYASGVKGYIPKFIGNVNLKSINLQVCNGLIAGRPGQADTKCLYADTFEQTRNLQTFYLNINNSQFAGPVDRNTFAPVEDTLTTLHFYAAGRFTGSFPDLEKCSKLSDIRTSGEGWTGPLPSFTASFNLSRVELYNNQFSGSVSYSGKNSLDYINVSGNNLTSISPTFSAPNLRYFYASSNDFTGTLPNLAGSIPRAEYVSLNNNQFDNYSVGLKGLTRIKGLDLSANILSRTAVDQILFDLVDNYKAAPRRGVTINLLGSNASPTPYPIISGIVSGLSIPDQPSVSNGAFTDIGSVGNVAANYFPITKTYNNISLSYDGTAGGGENLVATIKVEVVSTLKVVASIGAFSAPGTSFTTGGTFTDNGSQAEGSGARVAITVFEGEVTGCSLISGGSGYIPGDKIVISGSNLGSPGDDVVINITSITPIVFSSATYSIQQINSGGANYSNGDTLKTADIIEFADVNGNIDFGHIKINVSNTTQRTNTQVFTGFAATQYLRNVGWVVQVNN
jgi:Leucine-rich repeat (LRR) protein